MTNVNMKFTPHYMVRSWREITNIHQWLEKQGFQKKKKIMIIINKVLVPVNYYIRTFLSFFLFIYKNMVGTWLSAINLSHVHDQMFILATCITHFPLFLELNKHNEPFYIFCFYLVDETMIKSTYIVNRPCP